HPGLPLVTVGQRAGLHLRPRRPDAPPLYVLRLDPARNRVVVGPRDRLQVRRVDAADCAWVSAPPPEGEEVVVQPVAHGEAVAGRVLRCDGPRVSVELDAGLSAAAPGQSLVVYSGDEVLGGGLVATAAA